MFATARAEDTKKTRDVVHDIFFEASKYITNDEFWKNFFIDLSKNKLARKIHIDGKHISHHSKRMKFTYNYENKTPEEVAHELRKIISNTMCIYSDVDMTNEQEGLALIVDEFKDAKTEDDWKKVKNKKMKDHLISHYVLAQKALHSLSWQQTQYIYSKINEALYVYRTHKANDILMVNGNIESIEGITITADGCTNDRLQDFFAELDEDISTKKKVNLDKEWLRVCTATAKKAVLLLCDETEASLGIKKKASRAASGTKKKSSKSKSTKAKAAPKVQSLSVEEAEEEVENDEVDEDNPDETTNDADAVDADADVDVEDVSSSSSSDDDNGEDGDEEEDAVDEDEE